MTKDQFIAAITGFSSPAPFVYYPQGVSGKDCYMNADGSMIAIIGSKAMWYQGTKTLALGSFQSVYNSLLSPTGRYS